MQKELAEAFIAANETAGFDEDECRIREDYIGCGCSEPTTGIVGSMSHLLSLAVAFPEKFVGLELDNPVEGFCVDDMGKYDQIIY